MRGSRKQLVTGLFPTETTDSQSLASAFVASWKSSGVVQLPLPMAPNNRATYMLALGASCLEYREDEGAGTKRTFRAFLRMLAAEYPVTHSDQVVIAPKGSARAWAAAVFAALAGRTLIVTTDIDNCLSRVARDGVSSITVFSHPRGINCETLLRVAEAPDTPRVGLIPTLTGLEAWAWIARWALADELFGPCDSHLTWFDGIAQHAATEALEWKDDEPRSSQPLLRGILMEYHSKESCGLIGSGDLICGKPTTLPHDLYPRAPGCIQGTCIWSPDRRTVSSRIAAEHLVMLTCDAVRFSNAKMDHRFNIGIGAFQGFATSLVAPYKVIIVTPRLRSRLPFLYCCRLSLGNIVCAINRAMFTDQVQRPAFALLGDPDDVPNIATHDSIRRLPQEAQDSRQAADNQVQPRSPFRLPFTNLAYREGSGEQRRFRCLQEIAERDCHQSLWLPNLYSPDAPYRHRLDGTSTCFACGEEAEQYVRTGATKDWTRRLEICRNCGIIADVPTFVLAANLRVQEQVRRGDELRISAELMLNTPVRATFAFAINHANRFGWSGLPAMLDPGGSDSAFTVSLSLKAPPTAIPLVYSLHLWCLLNGDLCLLARPFILECD